MGVQGVHGARDAMSGEGLWPPVGDTMLWGPWSHPLTFQLGPHSSAHPHTFSVHLVSVGGAAQPQFPYEHTELSKMCEVYV